ncbi:MAG: DNA cytosine methyltransferase [Gemmataceae bacterium]|nr:DNA cytosine methyltransferase [Gemmataceae bacterium]
MPCAQNGQLPIFGINGVAPTLTSTTSRHYERYKIGDRFRRLTNIEYARIQGFPDNYCSVVSMHDQYVLFGNAVPPPMAKWVIERITADGIGAEDMPHQMDLFSYAHQRTTA